MIDPPPPTHGLKVVFPEASRGINEAINHQVKKGLADYHTYLMTFNGRKVVTDWLQEQADAIIYGTQMAMEYEYCLELLAAAYSVLGEADNHLEPGDSVGTDIQILRGKMERVLESVSGE